MDGQTIIILTRSQKDCYREFKKKKCSDAAALFSLAPHPRKQHKSAAVASLEKFAVISLLHPICVCFTCCYIEMSFRPAAGQHPIWPSVPFSTPSHPQSAIVSPLNKTHDWSLLRLKTSRPCLSARWQEVLHRLRGEDAEREGPLCGTTGCSQSGKWDRRPPRRTKRHTKQGTHRLLTFF